MSEQYRTHEKHGESQITTAEESKQHHERLHENREKAAEHARRSGHETETIRHEVQETAISGAEYHKPQSEKRHITTPRTKADKVHAFDTIMHHVHQNMSKSERRFSGFIHKPAVEKTSEALGKTIARPSGIAGATIAAFLGLLSIYSIAKFAGFELSGSEMPLLLLAGFGVGLLVEWFYKVIRSLAGQA
ncbi:MAG: hypothetical protein U0520_00940 [Candidatus Saccharimonadales bacterium]